MKSEQYALWQTHSQASLAVTADVAVFVWLWTLAPWWVTLLYGLWFVADRASLVRRLLKLGPLV